MARYSGHVLDSGSICFEQLAAGMWIYASPVRLCALSAPHVTGHVCLSIPDVFFTLDGEAPIKQVVIRVYSFDHEAFA